VSGDGSSGSARLRGVRARIRRLKTLPVLPTLLTAGNLACGITAILCAAHYDPVQRPDMLWYGAVFIFIAMVCDMLDGKVARMTGTEGPFGAELDSLSDVVSFGVAPAILVHRLILETSGVFDHGVRLLWFFTVFYPVMAAIRLARYNVEHSSGPTTHFRGMPSPGAAAVVCAWIILFSNADAHAVLAGWGLIANQPYAGLLSLDPFRWGLLATLVVAALLMVSTIPYPHFGNAILGRLSFHKIIFGLLVVVLLVTWPAVTLFTVTTGYLLYGLGLALVTMARRARQGRDPLADEDDDAEDAGLPIPGEEQGPAHGR
jgi:CDP-diacylglycerol--serine O-phosphatidyltransferase